jgi:glycine hydroxymethyltransferase
MLVDLRNIGLTGKVAEKALDDVGITVNKNTVPFETESPFITSGIRIGTPAVTTRGMKENAMKTIAEIITKLLKNINDEKIKNEAKKEVQELCDEHPLYKDLK